MSSGGAVQVAYHDVGGTTVVIQEGGMLPVVTAMKPHQNSAGDLPSALCLFASCLSLLGRAGQAYSEGEHEPGLFTRADSRICLSAGTALLMH